MEKIEVTTCNDCMFCFDSDFSNKTYCRLDDNIIIKEKNFKFITPKECPLKEKDYLFTFKK